MIKQYYLKILNNVINTRNSSKKRALKWIGQDIKQAVYTDFADDAKNISMKNVIKDSKSQIKSKVWFGKCNKTLLNGISWRWTDSPKYTDSLT